MTKQGKAKAVTSTVICKALNINWPRLRKIINHIRINNLLPALCSSSTGYYVATNMEEINDFPTVCLTPGSESREELGANRRLGSIGVALRGYVFDENNIETY